jgi:hypothetical protein
MLSLALSNIDPYVAFGFVVVFMAPIWARMFLAFLRDLDDYRSNRPKR